MFAVNEVLGPEPRALVGTLHGGSAGLASGQRQYGLQSLTTTWPSAESPLTLGPVQSKEWEPEDLGLSPNLLILVV